MAHFGTFWNVFNLHHTTAAFDEMITDPNCTVEQLLEDDNIISEFKGLNPKLLDYCTDDKIKNFIKYVIEEPPEDADRNRGYKYPFTSTEILTADVHLLLNAFFGKNPNHAKKDSNQDDDSGNEYDDYQGYSDHKDDADDDNDVKKDSNKHEDDENAKDEPEDEESTDVKKGELDEEKKDENESDTEEEKQKCELAHYFFSFLNKPELNITLIGYFGKVLNHLLLRRQNDTLEFLYENPQHLHMLVNHLEHRNLAEAISKIISLETSDPKHADQRTDILKRLLTTLFSEEKGQSSIDRATNICFLLSEIVRNHNSITGGKLLVDRLTTKENTEQLFTVMFSDPSKIPAIGGLLIGLINYFINIDNFQSNDTNYSDDLSTDVSTTNEGNDQPFYNVLAANIDNIIDIIDGSTSINANTVPTQYGADIQPFGIARLKLVELVSYAIKLGNVKISRELSCKKIFTKLMNLMTKYQWNSMLHNFIERIFIFALESDSHVLKKSLLEDAKLVKFLRESSSEPQQAVGANVNTRIRKGYLGQITRLAVALEKLTEKDELIRKACEGDDWKSFESHYLTETLKNDNHDLAGYGSKKESDDYSDDNIHFSNESVDRLNNFIVNPSTQAEADDQDQENQDEEIEDESDNIEDPATQEDKDNGITFVQNVLNKDSNDWFSSPQQYEATTESSTNNETSNSTNDFWSTGAWKSSLIEKPEEGTKDNADEGEEEEKQHEFKPQAETGDDSTSDAGNLSEMMRPNKIIELEKTDEYDYNNEYTQYWNEPRIVDNSFLNEFLE